VSAEIIAWLNGPEGEAWSREEFAYQPGEAPPHLYQHGPGEPGEDPCGRPPLRAEEIAATEIAG
jgi:hypothetical protein